MMEVIEDHEGKTSSVRVMSFMALIAAIFYGYVDVINHNTQPLVTFAFLIAAFCPKVLQAFVEKKLGVDNAEETPPKT